MNHSKYINIIIISGTKKQYVVDERWVTEILGTLSVQFNINMVFILMDIKIMWSLEKYSKYIIYYLLFKYQKSLQFLPSLSKFGSRKTFAFTYK